MKETRTVTQYRLYTLYALMTKVIGKRPNGTLITRLDRVLVAFFDDLALVEAYEAGTRKQKSQAGWSTVAVWEELEPAADQFSLPFNPAPEEPEQVADINT